MLTRDKVGHYIMIKGSIHQEDITNVMNVTQHQSAKIYSVNTDLKKELEQNAVIGNFSNPLSAMNRSSK